MSEAIHDKTGSMLPYEMKMNIVSAIPQKTISAAQRMGWAVSEKAMALGDQMYQPPAQSALLSSPVTPSGLDTVRTAPIPIQPPCAGGCAVDVRSGASQPNNQACTSKKTWSDYKERYQGEENEGFQQTALRPSAGYRIQPAPSRQNTTEANMSSHGPELSRWVPETLQTRVEVQPKHQAPESDFAQDYYTPEEASKYDSFTRTTESTSWTTKEARQGVTGFATRNGGYAQTPMMRYNGMQGTFMGEPEPTLTPEYQLKSGASQPRSPVEAELNKYGPPIQTYGVTRTTRPIPMYTAQQMTSRPPIHHPLAASPSPPPAPGPSPAPVPTHLEEDFACADVDIVTNQGAGKFISSTFNWLGKVFQCTYYKSWKGFFNDLSTGVPLGKAITANYRIVYFLLALGILILVIAIIVAIATPSKPQIVRLPPQGGVATASPAVDPSATQATISADVQQAADEAALRQQVQDQKQVIQSLEQRFLGQGSSASMYGSS